MARTGKLPPSRSETASAAYHLLKVAAAYAASHEVQDDAAEDLVCAVVPLILKHRAAVDALRRAGNLVYAIDDLAHMYRAYLRDDNLVAMDLQEELVEFLGVVHGELSDDDLDAVVLEREEIRAAGGPVMAAEIAVAHLVGVSPRQIAYWRTKERPSFVEPTAFGEEPRDSELMKFVLEMAQPFRGERTRARDEVRLRRLWAAYAEVEALSEMEIEAEVQRARRSSTIR